MKEIYRIFILIFLMSNISLAQEKSIANKLQAGTSVFYYQESYSDVIKSNYGELSISTSFNVNLSSKIYLGLRNYLVRVKSNLSPSFKSWHYLIGPTLKYKIMDKKRIELYTETGLFMGNYCPNCYPSNEYYNSKLFYWSFLVDLNFQPIKSIAELWITFSFSTNNPIRVSSLHGYNLPLLGIQYRFGK